MTPGKITTEMTFTVKMSLISDERAIDAEVVKTTTAEWVRSTLEKHAPAKGGDQFQVEIVPRASYIYDLRGLPE